MHPCDRELWSYAEIAAHLGVQPETVRSYRRHGLLPDPDAADRLGHPRWYAETIRTWSAHRPGNRGNPGR